MSASLDLSQPPKGVQDQDRLDLCQAEGGGRKKPELSGKAPVKIEVIDIKNNKTTRYDSISAAAALALNIGQSTISKYLARKDHKFYKNQFSFKKVSQGAFGGTP